MVALVATIHVLRRWWRASLLMAMSGGDVVKTWMVGTSPTMTVRHASLLPRGGEGRRASPCLSVTPLRPLMPMPGQLPLADIDMDEAVGIGADSTDALQ